MADTVSSACAAIELPSEESTPTFSVIIPTYNRAGLVVEAVQSVLDQTFDDHEIVVVDDGSTDDTYAALKPYFSRIRYVWQENRGLAAARNRGIEEARGEFLAFLDSDDLFEPRMLEVVLETFQRHPDAGGVATAEREVRDGNQPEARIITKRSPGEFFSSHSLMKRDTRVGCGRPAVVRRRIVEELGGFDESMGCAVDCELWIRYSFHMPIVHQPEPLVLRRVHGSNLSLNRQQDARDWLEILQRLEHDHPEFVREHWNTYRKALAKNCLRYGREVLAEEDLTTERLSEARLALARAARLSPWWLRARVYLLWSRVAPSTYSKFRRWELDHITKG